MRVTMLGPLQNLRAFLINKPPLVIFTACLATFAAGFLFVANYVLSVPIKDPDALDWNDVIEQLVRSELCVSAVHFGGPKAAAAAKERNALEGMGSWGRRQVSVSSLFAVKERTLEEVKLSMSFDLKLGEGVRRLAKGTEILWGHLDLEDLGLKNTRNEKPMKVFLDLGAKHGLVNCTSEDFCSVDPFVCVTFQGPVQTLPQHRESRQCMSRSPSRYDVSFSLVDSDESCAGVSVPLEYERDSSLTENLNRSEQVLMHRHLTYTSYFLFVMVITVLGFAGCKSHSPARTTVGSGSGGGGGGANGGSGSSGALLTEKMASV